MDERKKSLGQVAYEAYGDARGWKVVSGLSMPAWNEQTVDLCSAWECAALAAVDAYRAGNVVVPGEGS